MDTIIIRDLAVSYRIGVTNEERAKPQRLLVTVEMGHDFDSAAGTDDLKETIDYHAVSRRILSLGEGREWKLIEKLALNLAVLILEEFHPATVTVEVKKFVLPEARYVSARVNRPK